MPKPGERWSQGLRSFKATVENTPSKTVQDEESVRISFSYIPGLLEGDNKPTELPTSLCFKTRLPLIVTPVAPLFTPYLPFSSTNFS